jgi:hypothetical protein
MIEQSVQLLGYGMGCLGFECSRRKRIFCFLQRPDRFWGSQLLIFNEHRLLSPDVRLPGRKTVHCSSLNAFMGWKGITLALRCSGLA